MNPLWHDHGPYWELKAPQGDDLWLEGRIGRVTTSTSAAMADRSRFKTPEEQGKIISGLTTETFTDEELARMNHGTNTEPEARRWYINQTNYNIVERGLIVPKWDVRLGASVDGDILNTDGIIEIKAPVKMYYPLKQYMDMKGSGWVPPPNYYAHIYKTHFDQMQHAMIVMGKKWCVYIVYSTTDRLIFTQKIPFLPEYWENHYKTIIASYNKYVVPYLKPPYPLIPPTK